MEHHAERTISDLEKRLWELETEARKIKITINCLCDVTGQTPKYPDIEKATSSQLKGDEYHGRPLATVITDVLETRKSLQLGPATVDEIYNTMLDGGYRFTAKTEAIAKRGLAISMSKNQKFHKLPNNKWGLTEWYPELKEGRRAPNNKTEKGNGVMSNQQEETPQKSTDIGTAEGGKEAGER
jgi:hypothetical protein